VTADRGDAGLRLDLVLRRHLTDVRSATRTRVQAWIENGRVTINGRAVRRVAARTAFGDLVAIALPSDLTPPPVMTPEEVELQVLFEDEHLLAVDKPAGMVVHPTYKHAAGTLMNALLWRAREWRSHERPSLVGRLDKLTSGIVLVAKTAAMHTALQRTLASTRSEKDYLAVVYGRVNVARGVIEMALGLDPNDRRKMKASVTGGAPSITAFERLGRVTATRAGLSLLRCRLLTGRTHQIRVHLATRGWPIVGDPAYGEPRWTQVSDAALSAALQTFPRQALHAWRVRLAHPLTERALQIEAPVPPDIAGLLTVSGLAPLFRSSLARTAQTRRD
jgi:23S rRNA pseudouridine1911/1915/1917 synthase